MASGAAYSALCPVRADERARRGHIDLGHRVRRRIAAERDSGTGFTIDDVADGIVALSTGTVASPTIRRRHRLRAFQLVATTRELGRDPEMELRAGARSYRDLAHPWGVPSILGAIRHSGYSLGTFPVSWSFCLPFSMCLSMCLFE
jgi:hypothetical protein